MSGRQQGQGSSRQLSKTYQSSYGTNYINASIKFDKIVCGVNCQCTRKLKTASEKAVPGYEYLKNLSSNSFGNVQLYRNKQSRGIVAIKEVSYKSDGQNIYHTVAQEVDLVKNIIHPNIATYYDFFVHEKRFKLYIVMEYANRGSLRHQLNEQIKKGPLFQQSVVVRVTRDVICGMNFLNSRQVLHCDLKPENILVGDNGRMKICDFGTAHSIHDKSKTQAVGTLSYMAPELFDGLLPDEKSEVWSLGIIFYELCTFEHPFEPFTNDKQLIRKIKTGLFKSLNCRLSGYSYRMQELLELMLQTNPDYRQNLVDLSQHELFG